MTRQLLIICGLLVACAAWGQKLPAPSPYPIFLLRYGPVKKDLGLTPQVSKKIEGIQNAAQKQLMAAMAPNVSHPNTTHAPTYQEMAAQAKKSDSSILALMSASQKTRLRQIGLQYAGVYGLQDPAIAGPLKITPDEHKRLMEAIKKRAADMGKTVQSLMPSTHLVPGKSHPVDSMNRITNARIAMLKALDGDARKILTPAQVSAWTKMKGKPFPVEVLYGPYVSHGPARS